MPRAGKLKMMGGRMVSARSKTGDPQCSSAMSAWQNIRRGNPASMALDAAMKILGQCRSKARALKQAGQHRTAGNEAKAQALESRVSRGGPITAKDRLAKARELRGLRQSATQHDSSAKAARDLGQYARSRGDSLAARGADQTARKDRELALMYRNKAKSARGATPRAQRSARVSPDSPAAAQRLAEIRAKNAAVKAEGKPLHAQALEAARRVPAEKRVGEKVFVHHAWQEYRKGGGKLGLNEFKSGLASSPEARMSMSRADLVQGMRRGDVKGSHTPYMGSTFNFIRTGQGGSGFGSKIQPRPHESYYGKPPASTKAAELVAKLRAGRKPAGPSLKEQAAKARDARTYQTSAGTRHAMTPEWRSERAKYLLDLRREAMGKARSATYMNDSQDIKWRLGVAMSEMPPASKHGKAFGSRGNLAAARYKAAAIVSKPSQPAPSLREQAAAHRASKGTPEQRKAAVVARIDKAIDNRATAYVKAESAYEKAKEKVREIDRNTRGIKVPERWYKAMAKKDAADKVFTNKSFQYAMARARRKALTGYLQRNYEQMAKR